MRNALMLLALCLALTFAPVGNAAEREIVARTEVTKWGQLPQAFEISGQALPEGVKASDFTITGEATGWGASSLHPFSCEVDSVEADGDGWRLAPKQFPDKYFYVKKMEVRCAGHDELGFDLEDITRTVTPVADDFERYEDPSAQLSAHVFLPQADEPVPVVIVFHGYGDTNNLLTYRTAIPWAEPEFQAAHPCAVIAPVIPDAVYSSEFVRDGICEGVLRWIDVQADAGKVDAKRVYAMGNSFGGMTAIEMAEQHPDRIAAVLALCPALNYSAHGVQRLDALAGIPVAIAQAEHDETIPVRVGRDAAAAIEAAGNPSVTLRIYTDDEMNAAGARLGSGERYSFHHVELAAMEPPEFDRYAKWLFEQEKQ